MPKLFDKGSNPYIARQMQLPEPQVMLPEVSEIGAKASTLNVVDDAIRQFQQFSAQRKTQLIDEHGMLQANNLVKDFDVYGKELIETLGGNIEDPDIQRAFKAEFNNYLSAQKATLYDEYFAQVTAYSEQSMQKAIDGLDQITKQDSYDNLEANMTPVFDQIDSYVMDGQMDPETAGVLKYNLDQRSRYNSIMKMVDDGDVLGAVQALQNDINLNDELFDTVTHLAISKQESEERKGTKKELEQDQMEQSIQHMAFNEAVYGIRTGTLDDFDIEKMVVNEMISEEQANFLYNEYDKAEAKYADAVIKNQYISKKLLNNEHIGPEVSDKDLALHYEQTVQALGYDEETGQYKPLSFTERMSIASQYPRPLRQVTDELGYVLTHPGKMSEEALGAYELMLDRNPTSLERMDKNARTVATKALRAVNFAGADPQQALQDATDFVYKTDPETKKAYADIFDNLEEFRPRKLATTIKNDLDADGKKLAPGVAATYHQMLKDEFIRSGNLEDARAAVKTQLDPYLGPTEFNEESGIFNDTEQIMFFPPEKMFPGISVDTMRAQLLYELQQSGAIPKGTTSKGLRLVSDNLTRQPGQPLNYAVAISIDTDEGPVEVLLTDTDGDHFRWAPNVKELKAAQDKLEE